MDLKKFCVKFFAQGEANPDEAVLIEIFQEWIRLHKLDGVLLDVVDYRHVPDGQGIMLVSHEINYAMDYAGGYGLFAQLKLGDGENHVDRLVSLVRSVAAFGKLLESDPRVAGQITLDGSAFHYMSNDRLRAPNTDDAFQALQGDLEAAAAKLYPGEAVTIERVENHAGDRLTAAVSVNSSVKIAALAA